MIDRHGRLRAILLFLVLSLLIGCGSSSESTGPRTVVVISIDTLRFDHLGLYGYSRDTSPALDALADESAVFERAYAQAPYTLPSHMSLFTSLYPQSHGVTVPLSGENTTRLSDDVVTLAEILRDAGFSTRGITDSGFVSGEYGFDRGFDRYDDNGLNFRGHHPEVLAWLGENEDRDAFLFLHTFDVHGPYNVPEPFVSRFAGAPEGRPHRRVSLFGPSLLQCHAHLNLERFATIGDVIDRYDGCIAFVDHELGRLFDLLRDAGRFDDAMIVVTSDHGEAFLENGVMIGHGVYATTEETHVPLIVKFPNQRFRGQRTDHIVELVDVMPTILAEMGLEPPRDIAGQDLALGLESEHWEKNHGFGATTHTGGSVYYLRDHFAYVGRIEVPPQRIIKQHLGPRRILQHLVPTRSERGYDVSADPLGLVSALPWEERAYDLSEQDREWLATRITDPSLIAELREEALALEAIAKKNAYASRGRAVSDSELSARHARQLAELGYIGADAIPAPVGEGTIERRLELRHGDEPHDIDFSAPRLTRADDILWSLLREFHYGPEAVEDYGRAITEHPRHATALRIYEELQRENPDLAGFLDWRTRIMSEVDAFRRTHADESNENRSRNDE